MVDKRVSWIEGNGKLTKKSICAGHGKGERFDTSGEVGKKEKMK